ncbi:hypothetical protein L6452_01505 [Arctium lappa]|uniref:Uncharacterized protein n=1 Tax=Arctium lappa TaxID=4217 RepID=A0ACB9FHN8_ARCLA|nr:hypothetical protein L6452_01505 [Arctium lappa]
MLHSSSPASLTVTPTMGISSSSPFQSFVDYPYYWISFRREEEEEEGGRDGGGVGGIKSIFVPSVYKGTKFNSRKEDVIGESRHVGVSVYAMLEALQRSTPVQDVDVGRWLGSLKIERKGKNRKQKRMRDVE